MNIFLKILFLLTVIFISTLGIAKSQESQNYNFFRKYLDLDSIYWNSRWSILFLPEVVVFPEKKFRNNRERIRYNRLVRNFLIVYPYTLEIADIYKNIEDTLNIISDDNLRKKYIGIREQQIMNTYKPKLRKMTLSQGILMVKLLDRETGHTAYEIVEELRGSIRAFFWQGFALLFGNNLRTQYDAAGDDRDIEKLIIKYESGALSHR